MNKLKLLLALLTLISSQAFTQKTSEQDSILNLISSTESDSVKSQQYNLLTRMNLGRDPAKALEYNTQAIEHARSSSQKELALAYSNLANLKYMSSQNDSSRYYLMKAHDISLSIGDSLKAANCMQNLAIINHRTGRLDEALNISIENVQNFQRLKDSIQVGNAYALIGIVYQDKGYENLALDNFFKALELHRQFDNTYVIAEDQIKIAILYNNRGKYGSAIEYFKASIENYEKANREFNKAQALAFIGGTYIETDSMQLARTSLEDALQISEKLNYSSNLARCHQMFALLNKKEGKYKQAEQHLAKTVDIWTENNGPLNLADAYLDLGKIQLLSKDLGKAERTLKKALKLSSDHNYPSVLSETHLELSWLAELQGKYARSLDHLKSYHEISDSIFNIEQANKIQELIITHETAQKDAEIALQENKIKSLNQELKLNQLQKILILGGLSAALIIALLALFGFRQKIKRNRIERERNEAAFKQELAYKKRELTSQTLHLVQKNEFLQKLKVELEEVVHSPEMGKQNIRKMLASISTENALEKEWNLFKGYFSEVHNNFDTRIKKLYPEVSDSEMRLIYCLKMNLSTKEIAGLLSVLPESIRKSKYRLKKKLNLAKETDLDDFLVQI